MGMCATVQPGVPVLQLHGGQCYQLVAREWNGMPYVFPVPVMPTQMQLPFGFAGMGSVGGGASLEQMMQMQDRAQMPAAAAAAAAAVAPVAHPAGVAAAAQAQEAAGGGAAADGGGAVGAVGGGDMFEDGGDEGQAEPLKLLLKLAIFVYILGQEGGTHRVLVLTLAAVAIFLAQTGRLDFVQRRIGMAAAHEAGRAAAHEAALQAAAAVAAQQQQAQATQPPAVGGAAGTPEPVEGAAAEPPPPAAPPAPPSFLRDVENVVVTFFTSLLPSLPGGDPDDQAVAAAM